MLDLKKGITLTAPRWQFGLGVSGIAAVFSGMMLLVITYEGASLAGSLFGTDGFTATLTLLFLAAIAMLVMCGLNSEQLASRWLGVIAPTTASILLCVVLSGFNHLVFIFGIALIMIYGVGKLNGEHKRTRGAITGVQVFDQVVATPDDQTPGVPLAAVQDNMG